MARRPSRSGVGVGLAVSSCMSTTLPMPASSPCERYEEPVPINIGVGADISIADLALLIAEVVGYDGTFAFDMRRPDGTPRKLLDIGRIIRLGWRAGIDLGNGIRRTYRWWLEGCRRASGMEGGIDRARRPAPRCSARLPKISMRMSGSRFRELQASVHGRPLPDPLGALAKVIEIITYNA